MSAEAVQRYISTYLATYVDASRGMMGKRGLQNLLIDSYEAGIANWTPRMAEEFKARRGYELLPWMRPVPLRLAPNHRRAHRAEPLPPGSRHHEGAGYGYLLREPRVVPRL